ncbi:chondroitin AC/alginate lyase [Lyophyllum atratum]|nr:chondroitin AC/alginate lyase [Lyophyllum atratum]
MRSPLLSTFLPLLILGSSGVQALTSYANDFVDPDFIVAGVFGKNTLAAQATILAWAQEAASEGPWSVTSKTVTPPSGDKHDYMSWAPYWWPDCSKAGNTTELAPQEIWKTCTYVTRDGQFNPDGRLINDVGNFQSLSDAVLYNAIAFSLTSHGSSSYSKTVVSFIKAWFLDDATKMNPNLNFGQMQRGPTGQTGSHTGILDLKGMAKIVSAIMILRKKNCTDWTPELDNQMNAWNTEYITWLETAPISLEEGRAPNNHGTFYYNQLAALKLLIGDFDGARNVTNTFFTGQYMSQITASGEQPLEAARTRPYHYHAYNLAAMITNARIAAYAGDKGVWNKTTNEGSTIRTALDFSLGLSAAASKEAAYTTELYPSIAAVASVYGDADGKYASFLASGINGYASEAYFLWNQPLAGGEQESAALLTASATRTAGNAVVTGGGHVKDTSNGAVLNSVNWALGVSVIAGLQYAFSF